LGDAVDKNDKEFEKSFPFVALPTEGSRGPLAKGTDATKGDVRNQLGDALTPTGTSGSNIGGMEDTTLIAVSAVSGAAGFLLIGTGLMWWRSRRRIRGYY
jgi:hypothetical protein